MPQILSTINPNLVVVGVRVGKLEMSTATGNPKVGLNACLASGEFYKPDVVLDNVGRAPMIADGVITITNRDVSGQIGINNNSVIIGGVVEGTGETGITAVCKLLLLSYGSWTFRKANPIEQVHLQQELNLHVNELKTFLSGPASIGLALPTEQALAKLQQQSSAHSVFGWETTEFRSSYDSTEDVVESYEQARQQHGSDAYVDDCNRLLEQVDKKRTEEIHVLNAPRKTQTDMQALVAGPLPSRKKKKAVKIDPIWVIAAATVVFGGVGFTMFSQSAHSTSMFQEPLMATAEEPAPAPVAEKKDEAKPGMAPYALPNSAAVNQTPPPAPAPEPEPEPEPELIAEEVPPMPSGDLAPAAPAPSPGSNQEVLRWVDSVRRNPRDVNARRELAYAYLIAGDPNMAIEQFYTVMKMQRLDSQDIITFANNLMAFSGRDRAKQFLGDVLRADPSQAAIRERLAAL